MKPTFFQSILTFHKRDSNKSTQQTLLLARISAMLGLYTIRWIYAQCARVQGHVHCSLTKRQIAFRVACSALTRDNLLRCGRWRDRRLPTAEQTRISATQLVGRETFSEFVFHIKFIFSFFTFNISKTNIKNIWLAFWGKK